LAETSGTQLKKSLITIERFWRRFFSPGREKPENLTKMINLKSIRDCQNSQSFLLKNQSFWLINWLKSNTYQLFLFNIDVLKADIYWTRRIFVLVFNNTSLFVTDW
jgi:hypothetical protein